jgi:hypothetical protein
VLHGVVPAAFSPPVRLPIELFLHEPSSINNMDQAFSKNVGDVLKHFDVKEEKGLSLQRVLDSRKRHGSNCMSIVLIQYSVVQR